MCLHVMSPPGKYRCCCLVPVEIVPSLFAQIHYLGNGKRRKLLIKDIPTLWLLQAVCRHLEPAVSSPLKEKKQQHIDQRQRNSASWQQPNSPATGEERGREKERGWEKTTHEDTFEDIFTHSLYTTSQHLMSLSYWRLRGLCWFLLRSSETPRANSKGREVSALLTCQKYESHSEWLTCCSAPQPVAALPHYPLKLITTCERSKEVCKLRCIPTLQRHQHWHLISVYVRNCLCSWRCSMIWKWTRSRQWSSTLNT